MTPSLRENVTLEANRIQKLPLLAVGEYGIGESRKHESRADDE